MSVSPPTRAITDNLADLIGNTPMVRLTRVAPNCGAEVIAKLEAYNPAGSVKDRIGVAMIEAAEAEGRIEPGRNTIVESTSGNTGIALAFVCAAKGYDLVITMPQGMSREREKLLRLYGAEVVLGGVDGGMNEAIEEARRLCRERGDCYVPNQFSNPANPEIHRRTTAEEIWRDTDGKIDVLVAGVGTGGTITGCGERLKERNPGAPRGGGEPAGSPVLSGGTPGPHKIQGIGAGFVPEVLNREVIDEIVPVEDEDAIETARAAAPGGRASTPGISPARRSGRRSRSARAPRCAASGSSRSCPTRATATSARRSSLPDARHAHICTRGRASVREDLAGGGESATRPRAASGGSSCCSPTGASRRFCLTACRMPCTRRASLAASAACVPDVGGDWGGDSSRPPVSGAGCSSITGPAW